MNTDFENSLKQILYRSVTCSIQQGQNEQDTENCVLYSKEESTFKTDPDTLCHSSLLEILAPFSLQLYERGQEVESTIKFILVVCDGIKHSDYPDKKKAEFIETLSASVNCLVCRSPDLI